MTITFQKCTYCKQPNATIGCVRPNCRSCFHFGCGIDNGTLNQFFGNFWYVSFYVFLISRACL